MQMILALTKNGNTFYAYFLIYRPSFTFIFFYQLIKNILKISYSHTIKLVLKLHNLVNIYLSPTS